MKVAVLIALLGTALAALVMTVTAASAQADSKVRVATPGIASDIAFFIADKKGYFRAEGLDVEMMRIETSPQMTAPLGMGQLDVGAGTVAVNIYNAVARHIGLRVVADKGSIRAGHGYSGLLVRRDHIERGRFRGFSDLKGMTIAVGTFGSSNASAVNEALKKGGLAWSDAHMVEINFPQHLTAHANKAIDASMTNEPTATRAVQQGVAVRFAGNDEIYPGQQTAVVLYSQMFARDRPQAALKFMRAYIRAARVYNDALEDGHIAGPNAEEVISILTEYTFIKDHKVHRQISPPAIDPDGRLGLASLRNDLAFFRRLRLVQDPDITVEQIIDTSFAEQAVKELGPYRPRNK
jgi:NitT/TauT family transport system substrate-binding protein